MQFHRMSQYCLVLLLLLLPVPSLGQYTEPIYIEDTAQTLVLHRNTRVISVQNKHLLTQDMGFTEILPKLKMSSCALRIDTISYGPKLFIMVHGINKCGMDPFIDSVFWYGPVLSCIDLENARKLWSTDFGFAKTVDYAAIVPHRNMLYLLTPDSCIAIYARTGKVYWKTAIGFASKGVNGFYPLLFSRNSIRIAGETDESGQIYESGCIREVRIMVYSEMLDKRTGKHLGEN